MRSQNDYVFWSKPKCLSLSLNGRTIASHRMDIFLMKSICMGSPHQSNVTIQSISLIYNSLLCCHWLLQYLSSKLLLMCCVKHLSSSNLNIFMYIKQNVLNAYILNDRMKSFKIDHTINCCPNVNDCWCCFAVFLRTLTSTKLSCIK